MRFIRNATIGLIASAVLAGCIQDPREFETSPWEVPVSQGVITCQLYSQNVVLWDRAVTWPDNVSLQEADDICLEEGRKWQRREIDK